MNHTKILILVIMAGLLATACGKKGDPRPPVRETAAEAAIHRA